MALGTRVGSAGRDPTRCSKGTEKHLSGAEAWNDFYLVAGASAAVLIGLLFVALSINRKAIAAEPHLAGQALQALFALGSVFVLSLVVLIPDQSSSALGAELIAGALLNLMNAVPRQARRMATTTVRSERMRYALRVSVYDGAVLLIMAAGASLAAGLGFAFYLLAAAAIALTLLAIANSWSLTVLGTGRDRDA